MERSINRERDNLGPEAVLSTSSAKKSFSRLILHGSEYNRLINQFHNMRLVLIFSYLYAESNKASTDSNQSIYRTAYGRIS